MKKLFYFLPITIVFIVASISSYGAEEVLLGMGNIALKADYINFTDDVLENSDVDKGFYVGVEGYAQIVPNLYLGTEFGYANPDGSIRECIYVPYYGAVCGKADTEVTFVPIELNLKYALDAAPNFIIDFGAGPSITYVKEEATISALGMTKSADVDDWIFGGQFFMDLNYTIKQFFIGFNVKYHLTEKPEYKYKGFKINTDYNYNNWRIGGHIGIMF
ncbi:MAG: outer membrane beta-barrel protein [Candidatus Parvarchaeum sp.]|nr:outer membrane beta-barrel protein [Candidatus Parvarchaeum tengchongense]